MATLTDTLTALACLALALYLGAFSVRAFALMVRTTTQRNARAVARITRTTTHDATRATLADYADAWHDDDDAWSDYDDAPTHNADAWHDAPTRDAWSDYDDAHDDLDTLPSYMT